MNDDSRANRHSLLDGLVMSNSESLTRFRYVRQDSVVRESSLSMARRQMARELPRLCDVIRSISDAAELHPI